MSLRTSPTLAALLLIAASLGGPARAGTPCGATQSNPEGPAFDPRNVCATFPPPQLGAITNSAMQQPERVAWEIFSELNRPVPGSRESWWQTFPEQAEVYPPDPDPANPPRWEDISGLEPVLGLRPSTQQGLRAAPDAAAASNPCDVPNSEEVRINRDTFDYLIANELWYVEGKAKRFAEAFEVDFPTGSREVKANWRKLDASDDRSTYLWKEDSAGQAWGLVALHIVSKEVPNWIWATFEHATNPCYAKYLQAQDSFGLEDGKVTDRLLALFDEHGLDPALWSNYRLDGAQVTFTDPTGRPIVLGNSITEFGFQTTASCMTCHARATSDASGSGTLPVFNEVGQSDHGAPDPRWYYSAFDPVERVYMQLDFLWSVAFCPNAIGSKEANCKLPAVDR
jgi:hypothetical protein